MDQQPLPYIRLANPITPERNVMRRSLLASVLDAVERNSRLRDRLAFFEIGPVFWPVAGQTLPDEPLKLAIVDDRTAPGAQPGTAMRMSTIDFFDLKGIIEALLDDLHIPMPDYQAGRGYLFPPR